jgi:hypothetical protein
VCLSKGISSMKGMSRFSPGRAYLGTVCDQNGLECSVVEDVGDFSRYFTAAHELGHG